MSYEIKTYPQARHPFVVLDRYTGTVLGRFDSKSLAIACVAALQSLSKATFALGAL